MTTPLPPEILKVADLLARGLTDKVIAQREDIARRTVRRRVARLLAELHASTRFQAGFLIGRHGLLDVSRAGTDDAAGERPKEDTRQVKAKHI